LFELSVHALVSRQLSLAATYRGQAIPWRVDRNHEADVALALHIDNMGSVQALGSWRAGLLDLHYSLDACARLLALDLYRLVDGGAELFAMAMFYHPAVDPDPPPEIFYHAARSLIILICGMLAGAVGFSCGAIRGQHHGGHRARPHYNLFGQHVSPRSSSG